MDKMEEFETELNKNIENEIKIETEEKNVEDNETIQIPDWDLEPPFEQVDRGELWWLIMKWLFI